MKISRREFLQGTASLAAMSAVAPSFTRVEAQPPAPRGANERINVAVIGVNGRGLDHIGGLAGKHNCVVTHICDCDSAVIERGMNNAEKAQKIRPIFEQDLRKIMDNSNIHAVTIATPNHWHSLAGIWAMQAGKHVYVEKPVSHNVWEGARLVAASRHYNKICQAGTQIRSMRGSIEAIDFIRSGKLGKVVVARGLCYKTRRSIGKIEGETAVPRSMDYDLWCGPAPRNPVKRARLHYDWHWIWEYGNGDLGNQGIHQMDVARWALGKNELSTSCASVGGRFGYVDDGETANTQIAVFEYGDAELIFEVRGLNTKPYMGAGVGNVIHCENGYVVFDRYDRAAAFNKGGEKLQDFQGGGDHYGNFVAAIRSGRRQDLKGEIQEGHLSSALCHLANISYRLGQRVAFTPRTTLFGQDQHALETLERMEEHLRNNDVNLGNTQLTVGRKLNIDPKTETIRNDAEANRLLTREYRRGFEVPAQF
jgi:predicted dehydrogenase